MPPRLLVALALVLGVGLRVTGLDVQSLWYDEGATVLIARAADYALLAVDRHPPLSFALFRAWADVVGEGDAALRLLPALVSCVSLLLFARLATTWCSPAARIGAVMLYAVSPFHIWHAQEVRMYAFVELGALVALLGASRGAVLPPRRRDLAAVAAGSAFAFGAHYLGALVVPAVAAVACAGMRARALSPSAAGRLVLASLLGLVVWAPWVVTTLPAQLEVPWGPHAQRRVWDLLRLPARHLLVAMDTLPAAARGAGDVLWAILMLGFVLQCVGAVTAWRARRASAMFAFAAWLVPTAIALLLTLITSPHFLPKYLIAASPAAVASIANGLAALRWRAVRVALWGAAWLGCLCITLWQRTGNHRDDYRGACAELVRQWRPGDRIVVTGGFSEFAQAPVRHYLRARPDIAAAVESDRPDVEPTTAGAAAAVHVVHRDERGERYLARWRAALPAPVQELALVGVRYVRWRAP